MRNLFIRAPIRHAVSAEGSVEKVEACLEEHSRLLEIPLRSHLQNATSLAHAYHPFAGDVYRSISDFVLRGGKRIASFTTALVCRGYGFADQEAISVACQAVELYRHAILIHDDLVDQDEERRGNPTIHRRYAAFRDERLGLGCSVFGGDLLFSMSVLRLFDAPVEPRRAALMANELIRANKEVNESQILDLRMEGSEAGMDEWNVMASKRAASLFSATLRMGGLLSGADADLALLGQAGAEMGYVFDIQDDIIDTYASAQEYGRDPGSDLKTLKRPLHILLAMRKASKDQIAVLRQPGGDVEKVRKVLRDTGAIQEAGEMAEGHRSKSLQVLAKTGMTLEAKGLFRSLLEYMNQSLRWYV